MSDLPASVPVGTVQDALTVLGIPVEHLRSVEIGIRDITVVQARVDDKGRPFVAGDELATVTTTIGIER